MSNSCSCALFKQIGLECLQRTGALMTSICEYSTLEFRTKEELRSGDMASEGTTDLLSLISSME